MPRATCSAAATRPKLFRNRSPKIRWCKPAIDEGGAVQRLLAPWRQALSGRDHAVGAGSGPGGLPAARTKRQRRAVPTGGQGQWRTNRVLVAGRTSIWNWSPVRCDEASAKRCGSDRVCTAAGGDAAVAAGHAVPRRALAFCGPGMGAQLLPTASEGVGQSRGGDGADFDGQDRRQLSRYSQLGGDRRR